MPWTSADADRFKKGLSKKQKKKWATVANSALASCVEGGGSEKECASRAVRIANSKFDEHVPFNPAIPANVKIKIDNSERQTGGGVQMKPANGKKFQYARQSPPDPVDGHVHDCAFDEDGNGGTSAAGKPEHTHMVWNFKVQPHYYGDFQSVHPGSIAFAELGECEMEIFRVGTHNGDDFTESDLDGIAANFHALKGELRPKLKITHLGEEEEQETLAGLASYGDVIDVFVKKVADGSRRLFAKVANVPKEVLSWIQERRFPERSIELYPNFKLGTLEDSPVYKNVLKAVALLGHQMPAVTGMAPIKLEECLECQGTKCFFSKMENEIMWKCPNCGETVPENKVKNSNTGTAQCPLCGTMVPPNGAPEKTASMMALKMNFERFSAEIASGRTGLLKV